MLPADDAAAAAAADTIIVLSTTMMVHTAPDSQSRKCNLFIYRETDFARYQLVRGRKSGIALKAVKNCLGLHGRGFDSRGGQVQHGTHAWRDWLYYYTVLLTNYWKLNTERLVGANTFACFFFLFFVTFIFQPPPHPRRYPGNQIAYQPSAPRGGPNRPPEAKIRSSAPLFRIFLRVHFVSLLPR